MTNKHQFRIIPLSATVSHRARQTRKDILGNTLSVRLDQELHQCRSCLRLSQPGEAVILLAHQPFPGNQPYAEIGPIFIHERECSPYSQGELYPPEFPRKAVVLRSYSDKDEIVDAAWVGDRQVEEVINELLSNPETAYLHARNSTYGCYMFRIERMQI